MLIYNPKQQRPPRGGHHFTDEDGVTLKEETYEKLVISVKNHRLSNNRPIGNPHADIVDYYSQVSPWSVTEGKTHPLAPWLSGIDQNQLKIYAWVAATWKHPPSKLLDSVAAMARMEVCIGCPHNAEYKLATEQAKQTAERAFLLAKLPTVIPRTLGYCRWHGWMNATACHIENVLPYTQRKKSPSNCWVDRKLPK